MQRWSLICIARDYRKSKQSLPWHSQRRFVKVAERRFWGLGVNVECWMINDECLMINENDDADVDDDENDNDNYATVWRGKKLCFG